jgi:hypothetical protein
MFQYVLVFSDSTDSMMFNQFSSNRWSFAVHGILLTIFAKNLDFGFSPHLDRRGTYKRRQFDINRSEVIQIKKHYLSFLATVAPQEIEML